MRSRISARFNASSSHYITVIPGGKHGTGGWNKLPNVPDWEHQMTAWLNARLNHSGPIGDGIRPRVSASAP